MSFFYSDKKIGKGVSKDEPPQNRFIHFFALYFRKFWKLSQLNMLYFLFCLPVVTIGPATAGFTYVLRNFSREEHSFVWWDFKDNFKSNFKQSFFVGIIDIVVFALFIINVNFYRQIIVLRNASTPLLIMMGATMVVFLLLLFMRPYVYMMIVTVDLPLRHIFKNAMIFSILGFFRNLISFIFRVITIVLMAVVLFILLWPISSGDINTLYFLIGIFMTIIMVFFGLSLIGFISIYNAYPLIKKYIVDPATKKDDDGDDDNEDDGPVFSDELKF
ncbi:MAG: DUF624 domain-containing protein [Bacillota bacterium]|nr:DUF624 domain-containing protein [Bacillota bacterium]